MIKTVLDKDFAEYGRVIYGYDTETLCSEIHRLTPLPKSTDYCPQAKTLRPLVQSHPIDQLLFGGLPIQLGYCCGYNTRLNCLEYHKTSEVCLGTEDFIWLLAKRSDMQEWRLHTRSIRPFLVPRGTLIELYAGILHYMPCVAKPGLGFQVMLAAPKGTGAPLPPKSEIDDEDKLLWGCNKWLLAHPNAAEAGIGAYIGLDGNNVSVTDYFK